MLISSSLSLPNNVWRLIVFVPFLIIIKSPKQSLGDLLFLLRFLLLSLPNKVWGTYCFCSVSYYYFYFYYYYYYSYSFFLRSMNLSTADLRNYRTEFHETWWSYRSTESSTATWACACNTQSSL